MTFSKAALAARKKRAGEILAPLLQTDELVLICTGEPLKKPGGLDQTYPFIPHPDYFWLTGERHPFGISIFSPIEGWIDFSMPITRDEALWEGVNRQPLGEDVREIQTWLQKKQPRRLAILGEVPAKGFEKLDPDLTRKIQIAYDSCRRIKDAEEISLIKKCASFAHEGYKKVSEILRPGITELEVKIEYEAAVLKAGAEKFPYETIVGSGVRGATLHAIPTAKKIQAGEIILIDAGADYEDYCVDITRMFATDGKFNSRQQQIHDLVLQAQTESIAHCRAGNEWHQVHGVSAKVIAEGLRSLGIFKVSADQALETGAISAFLPHGVGHMVGLRVRDVGGIKDKPVQKHYGVNLRCDFALENGFVMTVEPGCYFVPALLQDQEIRKTYRDQINWTEVENWLDFGGVRIEDDIHVTPAGPERLT